MTSAKQYGINDFQAGVITILKCAITQKSDVLPQDFDLEKAYKLAKAHHIYPLIYEGALLCGVSRAHPVMKALFQACCNSALKSEAQVNAIKELRAALEQEQIDYMLFKGSILKELYPRPEMRIMGDADILIRPEQMEKAFALFKRMGYEAQGEDIQEYGWDSDALSLDVHKSVATPRNKLYYEYFKTGWDIVQKKDNGFAYEFSDEDHLLFLVVHFAKHYISGGIGIRHIIDFLIYENAKPDIDRNSLNAKLKILELDKFYANIRRTIDAWFNDGPWDEIISAMTISVFKSGAYGNSETHETAASLQNAGGKNVKWKTLIRTIFPPVSQKCYEYPILQKCPWLLPCIWVCAWTKVLLFRRHRISEQRTRISSLSDDKANALKKHLNDVGL